VSLRAPAESGDSAPMRSLRAIVLVSVVACLPKRDLPPAEIQKLTSLPEVMQVQATIADPQFKKIDSAAFGNDDWIAFNDLGSRIQVTAEKARQFSKGPEFDRFAERLGQTGAELVEATQARSVPKANQALAEMRVICKTCHAKFR
jgi:hypothetical protein